MSSIKKTIQRKKLPVIQRKRIRKKPAQRRLPKSRKRTTNRKRVKMLIIKGDFDADWKSTGIRFETVDLK